MRVAVPEPDARAGRWVVVGNHHFVLIAVLCRWSAGEPDAADDALEARWFTFEALDDPALTLSLDVAEVAHMARHAADGPAR